MIADEKKLIEALKKIFPEHIIYTDVYFEKDKSRRLDAAIDFSVYRLAKREGKTRGQWLTDHGFLWKETGYVEPDLRERDINRPTGDPDAFSIADYVFRKYPLAGEYIPTREEEKILYQSAALTVQKILEKNSRLVGEREKVVLVLETIMLLKDWSGEKISAGEADTFWRYIFQQYGFNPEGREESEQGLYASFREAIRFTLSRYRRFFAPKERQRYYTSLLLHALSPRQSIEAFFNILFDFYVRNLDFQYVTDDISYKLFTKGMRARWDSRGAESSDLRLRSDVVFSGLQTLFSERPGYMACLSDSIVRKMDALLRGEDHNEMDVERNYWDRLLREWYAKKSGEERERIQGSRRNRKVEYVATSAERIYIQYEMRDAAIGLLIPRIRLPQVGNERPIIRIYQGEDRIFQSELSVSGDDLCLTTRSRFLYLKETAYNFMPSIDLRVELEYMKEILYQSGTKLRRSFILFDADGKERTRKTGTVWLFTGEQQNVEFNGESGIYQSPHPGRLYRVNLGEVSAIVVDGEEVFADERTVSQFRCHTSVRRIDGIRAVVEGKRHDILPASFSLSICLPEGEKSVRYQISADGTRYTPENMRVHGQEFTLSPPDTVGVSHCVRVIDLANNRIRYEYAYIILPDCVIQLNQNLYRETVDEAEIQILLTDRIEKFSVPVPTDGNCVLLSLSGLEAQLEVELPVIHSTFLGASAFSAPNAIWHGDVPAGEFVMIETPDGWDGCLMLGAKRIPSDQTGRRYELGNFLRSGSSHESREPLWFSFWDGKGGAEKFMITEIAFESVFLYEPLEISDGVLTWRVTGNYIGESGSRFSIVCVGSDGNKLHFQASDQDKMLVEGGGLSDGRYLYQVSLKSRSVFSAGTEKVLFNGEFFVGDPMEFAFLNQEIYIREALCWDFEKDALKSVIMRDECAILCDFIYRGTTIASGEVIPAPEYTACLYFTDYQTGRRFPFSSRASREYEQINPVHVWIVNEHLLILHCATEDGVQIDNHFSTIVNRNPDSIMNRSEQYKRLETPDYFEYEVREG